MLAGTGGEAGAQEPNGEAGSSEAGASPGGAGSSGSGGASGGTGGSTSGGSGSDNAAGKAVCPALNQTFRVDSNSSAEDIALAAQFGCNVTKWESHTPLFQVARFEVATTRVEQVFTPHNLTYTWDKFALEPDCSPDGLDPGFALDRYPHTVAALLPPGIYTAVGCGAEVTQTNMPGSAAAVTPNIDCDHATQLPLTDPVVILDGSARFYSYQWGGESDKLRLIVTTSQTNGSGIATITGLDNAYSHQLDNGYLLPNVFFDFTGVPAGKYCISLKTSAGVGYTLSAEAGP
jgi:hypothetical protein